MWHWHVVRGNSDRWPQNLLSLSHNISKFCCRAVPKVTFPFLNVVLKMVWKVSYGVKKCGPVEQEWFFDYRGEGRVWAWVTGAEKCQFFSQFVLLNENGWVNQIFYVHMLTLSYSRKKPIIVKESSSSWKGKCYHNATVKQAQPMRLKPEVFLARQGAISF